MSRAAPRGRHAAAPAPPSFARRVKEELARLVPPRECCRRSELVALVRSAGTFHILAHGRYALEIDASDAGVARRVYTALSRLGLSPEIRLFSPGRARPRERFVVRVESTDLRPFKRTGALDAEGRLSPDVPRAVLDRTCCAGSYLRGTFLARGSISEPRRPAHLEIRAPDRETVSSLATLAARVGAKAGVRAHRGWAAYAKDSGSIGRLLAAMGAHRGYLEWEAGGVWSAVRAEANRLANCDQANVRRTVRAAAAQIAAIETLDRAGRLDRLPSALREIVRARREHPDASLDELGRLCRPPVSKGAVADRLRRLRALAEHGSRRRGARRTRRRG